jgi:hypothetical protein
MVVHRREGQEEMHENAKKEEDEKNEVEKASS